MFTDTRTVVHVQEKKWKPKFEVKLCWLYIISYVFACVVGACANQVRDQRLIKDAARARAAAEEVVAAAHGEPVAAPDMVQLEIGGTSPLVRVDR